jgi:predicted DNA-binding protein with PD1-like motif
MKYTKGSIGRIFLVKFENDDILTEKLSDLAKKEKIRQATLIFLGALKKGNLACGPKKPMIPPQPHRLSFKGGWEVMGIGTIFTNKSGPQIHLHVSMGKKNAVLTGCVREASCVFLVVEAVVLELKGVKATKAIDPRSGINLLKIL